MIHWQNGPNDRGQALMIGGMLNSQMYMGGELVAVGVSDVDFVMDTWTVAPAFAMWTVEFDLDSET